MSEFKRAVGTIDEIAEVMQELLVTEKIANEKAISEIDVILTNYYETRILEDNMDELVSNVEQWSKNKGLDKAESSKQFLKVTEEVGEVAAALARNNQEMLKDGIGDVVVTLIILAQQNGMTLEECLEQAYGEIAGRKGQMVNGVFVKDADLAP